MRCSQERAASSSHESYFITQNKMERERRIWGRAHINLITSLKIEEKEINLLMDMDHVPHRSVQSVLETHETA